MRLKFKIIILLFAIPVILAFGGIILSLIPFFQGIGQNMMAAAGVYIFFSGAIVILGMILAVIFFGAKYSNGIKHYFYVKQLEFIQVSIIRNNNKFFDIIRFTTLSVVVNGSIIMLLLSSSISIIIPPLGIIEEITSNTPLLDYFSTKNFEITILDTVFFLIIIHIGPIDCLCTKANIPP